MTRASEYHVETRHAHTREGRGVVGRPLISLKSRALIGLTRQAQVSALMSALMLTLALGAHLKIELSSASATPGPSVVCSAGDWPCSSQAEGAMIQPINPLFKVQLRVSQGENFIAEGVFPEVVAELISTGCRERFERVYVRQSVLNLEVGRNMSCDLARVIEEERNLALKLCLGNETSCFELPLASTPYAMKANRANIAEVAAKVNYAQQAHYAHKLASDPEALTRGELSRGALDFHTEAWNAVLQQTLGHLGDAQRFEGGGGFISWSPMADNPSTSLEIALLAHGSQVISALSELILLGERAVFNGHVEVKGRAGESYSAAEITGHSRVGGDLEVARGVNVNEGDVTVSGGARFEGALSAESEVAIRRGARVAGELTVEGATHVLGEAQAGPSWSGVDTTVSGEARLAGRLNVSGASRVTGDLVASAAEVGGSISVDEGALRAERPVTLSATLEVSEGANTGVEVRRKRAVERGLEEEQLSVEAQAPLRVTSPVTFTGPVEFAGGVEPISPFSDCQISRDLRVPKRDGSGGVTVGRADGVYAVTCNGRTVNLSQFVPDVCGDTRVTSGEECDLGQANSELPDAECRTDCRSQRCGDGVTDSGEECDDANDVEGDRCTRTCEINDRCKPTIQHELSQSTLAAAPPLVTILGVNISDQDRDSDIAPGCSGGGPQKVVKLSLSHESSVVFETLSADFDTTLHLRNDCSSASSLACDDDGGAGLLSQISSGPHRPEDGPLYAVVDSYAGRGRGDAQLAVMIRCPEIEPAHSIRLDEVPPSAETTPTNTVRYIELPFNTAGPDAGDHRGVRCIHQGNARPNIGGSQVAVELILPRRQTVDARVFGLSPGYDSVMLLKTSCSTDQALACNDDGNPDDRYGSRIHWRIGPGVFYLMLDGYSGTEGAGTLSLKISDQTL